jgi:DNA polymerase-1
MPDSNCLLLVDGTGALYRAFFAISSLATKAGTPTNALYGFIKTLHQTVRTWQPSHVVVLFDGGSPPERLALLPTYKSERKPMPDLLRMQLPLADEFLDRAQIRRIRIEGQEADDLIATLAAQARGDGAEVLISTSDKDLYQLVDDRISAIEPTGQHRRIGPHEVKLKMGVSPDLIVDLLSLTGDAVDGIPGVPGVGPKTAEKLLAQFGSLEQLTRRVSEIENPRFRSLIETHTAILARNRELVRLRRDIPLSWSWQEAGCRQPDMHRLRPFLESMEFSSLISAMAEQDLFAKI